MKKLMIAACAIAFAAVAQAAQVNWSIELVNGAGEGGAGWGAALNGDYTVSLVLGTSLKEGVIGDTIDTGSAVKVSFEDGCGYPTALALAAMSSDVEYYSQLVITDGTSTLKSGIYGLIATSISGDEVSPVWSADPESYGSLLASGESSLTGVDSFDDTYGTFTSTGWTKPGPTPPPGPTPGVPEPTSAMLLLLGVAGLSLRRKQK